MGFGTQIEESPGYAAAVAAYLAKTGRKRLPWGTVVSGGALTMTKTIRETHERHDLGEVAIALLDAIGVDGATLAKLAELPWNATGEALVAELQRLRDGTEPNNG